MNKKLFENDYERLYAWIMDIAKETKAIGDLEDWGLGENYEGESYTFRPMGSLETVGVYMDESCIRISDGGADASYLSLDKDDGSIVFGFGKDSSISIKKLEDGTISVYGNTGIFPNHETYYWNEEDREFEGDFSLEEFLKERRQRERERHNPIGYSEYSKGLKFYEKLEDMVSPELRELPRKDRQEEYFMGYKPEYEIIVEDMTEDIVVEDIAEEPRDLSKASIEELRTIEQAATRETEQKEQELERLRLIESIEAARRKSEELDRQIEKAKMQDQEREEL